MRLVSQTAIAALLAANVLGHPHASSSSPRSLQKRTVDLTAYKLGVGASYTSNVVIEEQVSAFRAFTKPTYVDTATTLVRSKFPNAEFRLVTNYVSGNGVGHVAFKQTVYGIDIDTADVNVNVGFEWPESVSKVSDITRLRKTAQYSHMEAPSSQELFQPRAHSLSGTKSTQFLLYAGHQTLSNWMSLLKVPRQCLEKKLRNIQSPDHLELFLIPRQILCTSRLEIPSLCLGE